MQKYSPHSRPHGSVALAKRIAVLGTRMFSPDFSPQKATNRTLLRMCAGAFFWDYSGYSYSGLGITEYTEFQFRKERQFWKRNTHGGGDLRTTMSMAASDFPPKISQKNAYSVYSE